MYVQRTWGGTCKAAGAQGIGEIVVRWLGSTTSEYEWAFMCFMQLNSLTVALVLE